VRHISKSKHFLASARHSLRFTEDSIITASSEELLEREVKPLVEPSLRGWGLELSSEKTHVARTQDGFDFIGQNVRDDAPDRA
jgi:RNA-directed DNA polymerase